MSCSTSHLSGGLIIMIKSYWWFIQHSRMCTNFNKCSQCVLECIQSVSGGSASRITVQKHNSITLFTDLSETSSSINLFIQALPFFLENSMSEEEDDMQQRATGWIRIVGRYSKDTASVWSTSWATGAPLKLDLVYGGASRLPPIANGNLYQRHVSL